jgi:Family of unknown function (DUF6496)
MARRYSRGASSDVKRTMRKRKKGTLRSGRSGGKVKSRKQAIAIGLSEARAKGKKVPKRKSKRKSARKSKRSAKKKAQIRRQTQALAPLRARLRIAFGDPAAFFLAIQITRGSVSVRPLPPAAVPRVEQRSGDRDAEHERAETICPFHGRFPENDSRNQCVAAAWVPRQTQRRTRDL